MADALTNEVAPVGCKGSETPSSRPPSPQEIYELAKEEGARRLDMPGLEKAATGFIAGVTIVFGIVALAVTYALVAPRFGTGIGDLAGALAFGIGLVFLVVGRTELFSENFFGPMAAAADRGGLRAWRSLVFLWLVILILNLVGGSLLAGMLTVEGGLPDGAPEALVTIAEETADKSVLATFVRAVAAGALLTLLSYMLHACDSTSSRIGVAYLVGFFVAIGPFDHVVVSALHLLLGTWLEASVSYGDVVANIGVAATGNLVGGLLLITLTHGAQVRAARARST